MTASDAGSPGRFATPRRLHPASILVGIDAVQLLQAFAIPVVALFGQGGRFVVLGLFVLLVGGFVGRVLDWRRRTYAFDGVELRVESGIIGRSLRTLDVARIQQIEIRKGLVQRFFGLAVVRVETAGGAKEPEVELRVITEADATDLRRAVRAAKEARATLEGEETLPLDLDTAPSEVESVLTVPPARIVLASLTGARLLALPAFLAVVTQFAGDASEEFWERVGEGIEGLSETVPLVFGGAQWIWIAVLILGATAIAALAAVVTGLIRDGGFRIDRVDGDLQVSRGLLSTRESLIPPVACRWWRFEPTGSAGSSASRRSRCDRRGEPPGEAGA